MFITIKRHTLLSLGLALLFLLALALALPFRASMPAFSAARLGRPVYVLDAGHGGEDGGAVSSDGVKESNINLSITRELGQFMLFLGQDTVMVRDDDVSIYSDGAETLRQKKISDLRNRVALVNETPGAILVSVHQNSLPSVPSVHGAQVFYGTVEPSAAIALSVQSALNQSVNAGNEKQEKQIAPSIYLFKEASCPAILIECGFLSNASETARLQNISYQKLLAASIAAGILNANSQGSEGDVP